MLQIIDPVAAAFEHLEFVVESFDKSTVPAGDKEIEDFLPPAFQCFDKSVKALQLTGLYTFFPCLNAGLGSLLRNGLIKDGTELVLQRVR